MKGVGLFLITLVLGSLCPSVSKREVFKSRQTNYEEQSCFAGFYFQDKKYEGGDPFSLPLGMTSLVRYSIGASGITTIGGEGGLSLSDLYSPDYLDYEPNEFEWDSYTVNNGQIDSQEKGPKDPFFASTCKIRAYYHNISLFGTLVTAMYDFTGFLVGDDTLLTCAHGLWLDATSGILDDGINNKYFPGRIEVYGAIGLGDQWGKDYPYYAKATDIYLRSQYLTGRSFGDDWAVLRLDRPIGKDLGHRVLTPFSDPAPRYEMIGYPTFNQSHGCTQVDGLLRNFMDGTVRYSAQSLDGMSGSPIYNSNIQNNVYSISTHRFDEHRVTYAMHLGYGSSTGAGIGVWLSPEIRELVNELNKKYRPSSVQLNFDNLLGTTNEGEYSLRFSEEYRAKVIPTNASAAGREAAFRSGASVLSVEFDFPVSRVSFEFQANPASASSKFDVRARDFYGNQESIAIGDWRTGSSQWKTISVAFPSIMKRVSFTFANLPYPFEASEWARIRNISFEASWERIPPSVDAPQFDEHEMDPFSWVRNPDENCATYAVQRHMDFRGLCQTNHNYSGHGQHSGIVPGFISGTYLPREKPFALRLNSLKADFRALGIGFRAASKYAPCSAGWFKIAIMTDLSGYYHFLRENSDGVWSHYFKGYDIYRVDSLGNAITDPGNAVIVSLGPNEATNANPRGNYLPVGSEVFDTLSLFGYFAVEKGAL